MYSFLKRLIDIVVASIVLLLLMPLLIPICIALKLTAEGHIFYFQKRIGRHREYFDIWKFATMLKDSPNMGTGMITLRNDPRVTVVGKFLRATKINELPQVINVLIGNMSLVGPRPLVDRTFNTYPKSIQDSIYNVKPGITGIGSIVFRDEEKLISETKLDPHTYYKEFIAPYKGQLEIWYQKHASMTVDLLIMFLTGWQIFFHKSDLVFNIFPDLPKRPHALTIEGAREVKMVGMEMGIKSSNKESTFLEGGIKMPPKGAI